MPGYREGKSPWYGDKNIKKVIIKDGVKNIGGHAFERCSRLESIEIPNSVTEIGWGAFKDCSLSSIKIPNSVTSIGFRAFEDCIRLSFIEIPNSVTDIGAEAFMNCYSLTSVIIPNSVKEIGMETFMCCTKLSSVVIPNSVRYIGSDAFCSCSSLSSIEIPNSVTEIYWNAFMGCRNLKSVEIPSSVTKIEDRAFESCENLTSITFEGTTPPEFGKFVFEGVNKSIPVYVPFGSRAAYKEALGDFGMTNIIQPPLSLSGSESYTQNSQIDDIDVSFTRNFGGYWESICIPFSLEYKDWKDDFEVARINAVHQYDDNDDGDIDRTILEFVKMKNDDSVIEPNTPYLIKAKTSGKKTISVENTTVYESKANSIECSTTTEQFTFIGLYKKPSFSFYSQTFISKYVMDEGLLSELTAQSNIGPYRWYMKRENRDSAYGIKNNSAKEISIRVVGEETTCISQLQITNDELPVYDLNGRKVNENNLKPGMYVKNGRKFVVK